MSTDSDESASEPRKLPGWCSGPSHAWRNEALRCEILTPYVQDQRCSPVPLVCLGISSAPCVAVMHNLNSWHRRLLRLTGPLAASEVLGFASSVIPTAFIGHLGAEQLSAWVLAHTFINLQARLPDNQDICPVETDV